MPVIIRLSRQGKRHSPFFRIAVADSRKAATGKFLEHIGYYDPNLDPPVIKVDEASALKWLKVGAQPSDTVRSLFRHTGLMDSFARQKKSKDGAETPGKPVPWKKRKQPKLHKKKKEALAKEAAKPAAPVAEAAPAVAEAAGEAAPA